jgi:hypothetical protein
MRIAQIKKSRVCRGAYKGFGIPVWNFHPMLLEPSFGHPAHEGHEAFVRESDMVAVLAHDIEIAPSENLTAGEPNLDWFCGQVGRSQTEEFELVFVSEGPRMRAGDPGLHLGKNLLDGIPFERL